MSDTPMTITTLRQAATEASNRGDYNIAVELLNRVVYSTYVNSHDWINYCFCMAMAGDSTSALSLLHSLARAHPNDPAIQLNCGILHFNFGDYGVAAKYLISTIDRGMIPYNESLRSLTSSVVCHIYGPFDDPKCLADLVQRWYGEFIKSLPPERTEKRKELNKKLHVAYVNNHFNITSYYTLAFGIIQNHSSDLFDIYCYNFSQIEMTSPPNLPDHITFRSLGHLPDSDIINIIDRDNIDILIDMNGFDATNKWGIYGQRPAPIMASWYNVFSPMGGRMFDYIIMDEVLCPPNLHQYFQEDILLLPCWTAMVPPEGAPEISPPPSLSSGTITFGCFNRAIKLNEMVLSVWKRILDAVPNSRLYLRNGSFSDPFSRNRVLNLAQEIGITPDQLVIHGWSDRDSLLRSYDQVDILLDPFPFNGGITSLEAMWQGVPIVALEGKSWGARLGAMLLVGSQCTEWLTHSEDEYVALAVKLASNIPELSRIRQGLRARLQASPIMDGATTARAMEALFQTMADRYRAAPE